MTVLFAVLDGVTFGCCLAVLPTAVQDMLDNSDRFGTASTRGILMVLLLCSLLFGFGRALTAFVNTLSLSRSAMAGILLTSLCLLMFSFSSTVAWLLCLRLALGLLSGYLGYFFELDRAAGLSRSAWVVAAGLSAFVASALYASVSHEAQLLPLHPASASFLCSHPVFASFFALATGVLVFFVLYVFSEKFGFIDDDDEQQRVASAFSEPLSAEASTTGAKPFLLECSPLHDRIDDGGESGIARTVGGGKGSSGITAGRVASAGDSEEQGGFADLQVPGRFLRGCQGDCAEALRRWRLTLEWRRELRVDGILAEPQPHFFAIKQHYPHFLHGRSVSGKHALYFEQLGKIDLVALREKGIGVSQLLRHYVFMAEYLWTHVEPDFEHGKSITVLDVEGVSVSDLVGDPLDFLKESTKLIQNHYVERSQKIFVVNASYMFSWLWRMVQPMINESTRRKISILSSDMTELVSYVGASALPEAYGGEAGSLGGSEEERQLAMFVHKLNSAGPGPVSASGACSAAEERGADSFSSAANYGSVLPSSCSLELPLAPRSLSRIANSRRCKMKACPRWSSGSPSAGAGGYSNVHHDPSDNEDGDDHDDNELGYSSSDDSSGGNGDNGFDEECKHATHVRGRGDHSNVENNNSTLVPFFVSSFYEKSVQTLKRAVYRQEEATSAFLGEENQFTFKDGKWVENAESQAARLQRRSRNRSRRARGTVASGDRSEDEESDEAGLIRAIQASQGYLSESEGEGEGMSLARRLRHSFRSHIVLKKREARLRVEWWSWLHWSWRAALFVSLESLPALLLLDRRHGGLGLPPIFLGGCALLSAGLLWGVQAKSHVPSAPGFFRRALTASLAMEVLSVAALSTLSVSLDSRAEWTFKASPLQMTLLASSLAACYAALLFSLGVATLFSAAVMTSHKSPLHAPFSRCKALLADSAGGALGLLLLLLADMERWTTIGRLLAPLLLTVGLHLAIAAFNVVQPHAAGRGVQLHTLRW